VGGLQFGTRVHPEFLGQQVGDLAVGRERLTLPARPVQRPHPVRPEPLLPRVAPHQRRQLAEHVGVPAEGEVQLDAPVQRAQVALHQRDDLVALHRLGRHVGQRWHVAPQRQRVGERGALLLGVPGGRRPSRLRGERREPLEVEAARRDLDAVAVRFGPDAAGPEQVPDPHHVLLDGAARIRGCCAVPQRRDQLVDADGAAGLQQQRGQHDPQLARPDPHLVPVDEHFERSQHPELDDRVHHSLPSLEGVTGRPRRAGTPRDGGSDQPKRSIMSATSSTTNSADAPVSRTFDSQPERPSRAMRLELSSSISVMPRKGMNAAPSTP
jgi:hypothetical protein